MRPRPNPFEKRKKEIARKERQKKKAERRDERERGKLTGPRSDRTKIPISPASSQDRSPLPKASPVASPKGLRRRVDQRDRAPTQ